MHGIAAMEIALQEESAMDMLAMLLGTCVSSRGFTVLLGRGVGLWCSCVVLLPFPVRCDGLDTSSGRHTEQCYCDAVPYCATRVVSIVMGNLFYE